MKTIQRFQPKLIAAVLVAFATVQMTGCASVAMPNATANANNVQALKVSSIKPVMTGEFKATGAALTADKGHSLRGANTMKPASGSFALQLRDQLTTDLKAAGLYDEASKAQISATVTENTLDAGVSKGAAKLAAQFKLVKDGVVVYDKPQEASSTWESSFVGAVAIPAAFNQFGALFQALVGKLIQDPEFVEALKK